MEDSGAQAYIVHTWVYGNQLRIAGRLGSGESFAAVLPRPERRRFRESASGDWEHFAGRLLAEVQQAPGESERSDRSGSYFDTGFGAAEEFLLFNGLRGPVLISGEWSAGRRVNRVYTNPTIAASNHRPSVVWAAFDIETDPEERVVAVSLVCGAHRSVLFLGAHTGDENVRSYSGEGDLLSAFAGTVREIDPDIITGWNIAEFDFDVLARRFEANGLAFDLGRAEGEPVRTRRGNTGLTRITVPGRQVVDAMRIVRGSGRSFDDMKLETVAQAVLGRGKHVAATDERKVAELESLRANDPAAFCRYCLEDSQLVLDILAETGMDELTLIRALLTGMNFELAWTSIPAFERIYALELVERKVLPLRTSRETAVTGAAGGTVLEATPGLFANVLVFDFRSLYPSVISTFNIDPLNFARTPQDEEIAGDGSTAGSPGDNVATSITAPNGARFSREPAILPALIETYFRSREDAIGRNDEAAAFVYKILMNSFYGVLGSPNCTYGHSALAGAITGFGKTCLLFARDFFRARGLSVLYGDTDSVFVYAGGEDLSGKASDLAKEMNGELDEHIRREYGVRSKIRIRRDTAYSRFLLPRLRTGSGGGAGTRSSGGSGGHAAGPAAGTAEPVRGRAKGYAGLNIDTGAVEIKGMEAARSDYTTLARRFQTELLALVFGDADTGEIDRYVRQFVSELMSGKLDDELIYRKMLRRSADEYRHSTPPQVRAARKAGWTSQRGRIEYIMTAAGPEPTGAREHRPDYRHYIDHQLKPIWLSVAEAVDFGDTLVEKRSISAAGDDHHMRARLTTLNPLDKQLELGL